MDSCCFNDSFVGNWLCYDGLDEQLPGGNDETTGFSGNDKFRGSFNRFTL
jgi:hypothetical protein